MSEGVRVIGAATAEEVAVVLAVLSAHSPADEAVPDGYARWRAVRRQALRPGLEVDRPS